MSTSQGTPSKKISWAKSMSDQIDYQNKLIEEAKKVAKNPSYKPRITIGKKNKHLFEGYIADAKIENERKAAKKKLTTETT